MSTRQIRSNFFICLILAFLGTLQITFLYSQTPIIPAYQSLPWFRTGGPPGGLGYDIRYNFAKHNLWYVTDNFAGIHLSEDRGFNWFPSTDGIDVRATFFAGDHIPVFCCTVDPINSNIVWIGTDRIGHILKSENYGYSWTLMDKGVYEDLQKGNALSFRGFTVDPTNSDIVYAMGEIASWGWTNDNSQRIGFELDMTQGIVFKTTNGGESWEEIWRGDNLARYCWINPQNPLLVYVSTGIFDREAANTDTSTNFPGGVGILRSLDGGNTWEELNQNNGLANLYVGSLYMHPKDPKLLLAAATQNHWSYFNPRGKYTGGVYQTLDGGDQWEVVLKGDSTYKGAGWGEQIAVVEINTLKPHTAYAVSDRAVYRSEWNEQEGYRVWKKMNRPDNTWGSPGMMAGVPIDAQCDPEDPMRIFVNNYLGGNFLSEDGGETWISAVKGYTGAQLNAVACSFLYTGVVFAGARTGIFRSNDGGEHWEGINKVVTLEVDGRDTTQVSIPITEVLAIAVDPADHNHILMSGINRVSIFTSWDRGDNWILVKVPEMGSPAWSIIFSPSDPTVVYAASGFGPAIGSGSADLKDPHLGGVFVSHNSGRNWTSASGTELQNQNVLDVIVHPTNPNIIYAALYSDGSHNKTLYKSIDGGVSWDLTNSMLPKLPVLALTITPSDPSTLFAGLFHGGVYKSTDGGGTWLSSSAGMNPEESISGIAVDPFDSQLIYASTWMNGVYLSKDGGVSWSEMNTGLSHHAVNALFLSKDGSVLYAGIWGDGVYRLGTPVVEPTIVAAKDTAAFRQGRLEQNYSNPFNNSTTINFTVPYQQYVTLKVYNSRGQVVMTLASQDFPAGNHQVRVDAARLPSGLYFYKIQMENFSSVRKMLILK